MAGKRETIASVREGFEKVKATYEGWAVNGPSEEAFRLQITSIGVEGIIGAANTELPDSEERRALVAEMAQWLADLQPKEDVTSERNGSKLSYRKRGMVFTWEGGEYIDMTPENAEYAVATDNVWDSAADAPTIARTQEAFEAECDAWLARMGPEEIAMYGVTPE